MLDSIITIFSIYGLSFLFKESDGPFDLMSRLRSFLMTRQKLGLFFYKLLSCYFCVGCHAGWIIYLFYNKNYSFNLFILWMLAGGAISLILDKLVSKLSNNSTNDTFI